METKASVVLMRATILLCIYLNKIMLQLSRAFPFSFDILKVFIQIIYNNLNIRFRKKAEKDILVFGCMSAAQVTLI